MSTLSQISDVFWGLVGPWIFLSNTFYYLPPTVLRLLRSADLATLTSPSRLQDAWFSAFWSWWGPRIRIGNSDRMVALLEGRVTGGSVVEDPVHPPVSGIVLEIGPGSGLWVNLFSKGGEKPNAAQGGVRRRIAEGVSKVYGVEPNAGAHPALRKRVQDAGLEGTYEIVPTGIESLSDPTAWNGKIEKGSVDCIVSILCLCSIPEPEKNIAELYSYLKKGGRWYLYEHVKATRSWPIQLYQRFVNLVWPRALNGCQLCRDTQRNLRSAGPWDKVDVAPPPAEQWFQVVPHIFGTFTK
ncbi:methyltransferase-like protein 7B [Colletotrichum spaethianum]|uniref:Methyltransferase-like protein 7B n=1 Tax=Colletotrichum spaethianum TaxID=700344 RepID=A0AA37LEF1_9PEZI|nr:methyltransferase-like protein 7B [Colletotrichum spaethianum]GKT44898.1 methyltransferase-like protein 7B [Colletotrichum spaethianum]